MDHHQDKILSFLTVADFWSRELYGPDRSRESMSRIVLRLAHGGQPADGGNPLIVGPPGKAGCLVELRQTHDELEVEQHLPCLRKLTIEKYLFRKWCVGRFDLPRFWFSDDELEFTSTEQAYFGQMGWAVSSPPKAAAPSPPEAASFSGRPSVMPAVIQEMKRRAEAREMLPVLSREAKHLADWIKQEMPGQQTPTPKTIENALRALFKELRNANPQ
ncbi:MAG: hypothetical protein HQL96_05020 [Magnetococcales bacterium]|nr:hypothetical protein [Magnetococcales bacterium]